MSLAEKYGKDEQWPRSADGRHHCATTSGSCNP